MPLHGDGDRRKLFISATAANYFGLPPADAFATLSESPELGNFLDDGNEFLLSVQHSRDDRLLASNKVIRRWQPEQLRSTG